MKGSMVKIGLGLGKLVFEHVSTIKVGASYPRILNSIYFLLFRKFQGRQNSGISTTKMEIIKSSKSITEW